MNNSEYEQQRVWTTVAEDQFLGERCSNNDNNNNNSNSSSSSSNNNNDNNNNNNRIITIINNRTDLSQECW